MFNRHYNLVIIFFFKIKKDKYFKLVQTSLVSQKKYRKFNVFAIM